MPRQALRVLRPWSWSRLANRYYAMHTHLVIRTNVRTTIAMKPIQITKPELKIVRTPGDRPRKSLADMAAEARGNDGTPGCKRCGGKLTKKILGAVTCSHCGRAR